MLDFLATNDLARLTVLALLFVMVVSLCLSLAGVASRRAAIKQDLRAIAGSDALITSGLSVDKETAWSRLADRFEQTGLNLADTQGDKLRQKLVAAGFESSAAPRIYTLVRLVMVFLMPAGFLLLLSMAGVELTVFKLYLYGAGLALLGLYLPTLFVTARADRRKTEITNGFPDCLDLLLVCVEAGLGLESALDRVGREMALSHPLVSRLLSLVTLQLRAGANRDEALRKMSEVSGVDEIRSFVTLLIQSDKLGTSLSDTLRVYAGEMREKRRLRAEEKAHRIPVLISIPLVVCMLPTMIGVLMLPGVVRVIRVMFPAMAGGG